MTNYSRLFTICIVIACSTLSIPYCFAGESSTKAPTTTITEPAHIHFQVNAQEKVAGDTMQAVLRLTVKNRQPSIAAQELNQKLHNTMEYLRENHALHVETNQYSTQQLFDEKGKAKDWEVNVELIISSEQWDALSKYIATLQNRGWLFSGVTFEVSPEQRKAAEKRLIQRALADWNERAHLIAKQLQFKKWHLGTLEISDSNAPQPMPRPFHSRIAMMAAVAPAAPDVAGSDTTIDVTVNGELIAE